MGSRIVIPKNTMPIIRSGYTISWFEVGLGKEGYIIVKDEIGKIVKMENGGSLIVYLLGITNQIDFESLVDFLAKMLNLRAEIVTGITVPTMIFVDR